MKNNLQELGRAKALEVLKHRLHTVAKCNDCGAQDVWITSHNWEPVIEEGLCSECLYRDLLDNELRGGHSSEWIFEGACRVPDEKSITYKVTMRAYFDRIRRGVEPRNAHKQAIIDAAISISSNLSKIYEAIDDYTENNQGAKFLGHSEWFTNNYPFNGDLFEFISEVDAWVESMENNGETK
jgi:hypothetical protein